MDLFRLYFKEIRYLKMYIISIVMVIVASFSVYFFLDEATIATIADEDHLFEYLTSLSFLVCSSIFFLIFFRTKNLFFLLLAFAFLIGFGEEISWGQRILGFSTPERLMELNAQKEFNFHNIATWEINFIFKVFTLLFGIVLPLLVYHSGFFKKIAKRLRIPVPPISIGMFFMLDWLFFRFFLDFVLHPNGIQKYYFSVTEIYEFITSFIMFVISLYFLNEQFEYGTDIKDRLAHMEKKKINKHVLQPV